MSKLILDVTCGSRMMWFDKDNPLAIFCDIRKEVHELCDGRTLEVNPDIQMDFTQLDFGDNVFRLVVFDPPHIDNLGQTSFMAKKYGILKYHWRDDIRDGFQECMRVLMPYGVLIFKWNEHRVKLNDVLPLFSQRPLFGHTSGKHGKTIWLTFIKLPPPPPPPPMSTQAKEILEKHVTENYRFEDKIDNCPQDRILPAMQEYSDLEKKELQSKLNELEKASLSLCNNYQELDQRHQQLKERADSWLELSEVQPEEGARILLCRKGTWTIYTERYTNVAFPGNLSYSYLWIPIPSTKKVYAWKEEQTKEVNNGM